MKPPAAKKPVEKAAEPVEKEKVPVAETPVEKDKTSQAYDFPWEYPDGEEPRTPCPACKEPVHPDAKVCIHCGSVYVVCPNCRELCAALHDPKMATEQRLNRIFKQYTLFSLALPSLPVQPILNCSECGAEIKFEQRSDDNEETLKNRLDAYEENAKPIIQYYKDKELLRNVNAENTLELTENDIKKILEV